MKNISLNQVRKYVVREALLPLKKGGYEQRWYVYKDYRPIQAINQFISRKSMNSPNTGRTYAYALASWLNFLDFRGTTYDQATLSDIKAWVEYFAFGIHSGDKVAVISNRISYNTISVIVAAVQGFYGWIDGIIELFITAKPTNRKSKQRANHSKHSFLYGQIKEATPDQIIDFDLMRLKSSGYKKHWLTEAEKTAILGNFYKARDKAIFMLLCEAMRIDEVLSIEYSGYDRIEKTVKPIRSKGYSGEQYKDKLRIVAFSDPRTEKYLDQYIDTERADVEVDIDEYVQWMFVNLKASSSNYGKPVSYRNYWEILKRATARAGIDPAVISTHVGRRTRIQELLEDGVQAEIIRQIVNWASLSPLDSYRNHASATIIKKTAGKSRIKRSAL